MIPPQSRVIGTASAGAGVDAAGRSYRNSGISSVWLWSAARTNPSGFAEDMTHLVTTRMIEDAAEYEPADKKTIYIKKSRDAGNAPYKLLPRPKEHRGDKLPSF